MAQVVAGVCASHSTLMNTHWDETIHKLEAERFRDGLAVARDHLAASSPDVAIIIGSNHFRGFWLDLIPSFTMGVGACIASGESGTPKGPQRVHEGFARGLVNYVVEGGHADLAFSAKLQIDHGQTHAIQYLLDGVDAAIVPLVLNVFAPPLPTLRRCEELAIALRAAIDAWPEDLRVAVIGSGGLSHRLPWPDWRRPATDDDEFMVEAWRDGRLNWADYDVRRRQIIRAAESAINSDFDRDFMESMEKGQTDRLYDLTTEQILEVAGNGAQEIRSWLMTSTICGNAPATPVVYEAVPDWLTGMGVMTLSVPSNFN